MIPWDCDAIKPLNERSASQKFRRVRRWFEPTRLEYGEACELVAFVDLVPIKTAKWIFDWYQVPMRRNVQLLVDHLRDDETVRAMITDNMAHWERADGLAVLRAMQEGGWTKGTVPPIVRAALLDLHDAGMSRSQVAESVGLTLDQVRVAMHGQRTAPARVGLAGLVAN